jgi:fructosamine-3-kinase
VEHALEERGLGSRIEATVPVRGGCINNGARIETDSGVTLFLKWNPSSPTGMFEVEAAGLSSLSATSSLRVPDPLAWGDDQDGTAWLIMEYVASSQAGPEAEQALARGLAEMHACPVGGEFGWESDNWIGSLEQNNTVSGRWDEFWRDRRIGPQLQLARRAGRARNPAFDALVDVIPRALSDIEPPELVHGDLWGGNWFASESGEPVLIDPAVYRGHGEVDLAMSELFGGFGPSFYEAYDDVRGIQSEYTAYRRDLYQLYYLLVHVNLFGEAYEAGSLRAAQRVLSQVG